MSKVVTIVAVGVIGLLGYGAFRALTSGDVWEEAAAALPGELAKAKAAGLPLELKDIGLPPNVPDKDNAAIHYIKAIKLLQAMSSEKTEIEKVLTNASTIPGALSPAERSARAKIAPIIFLARQGANERRCDFKRDYSLGFELALPEFADMKAMVKLLSADAVLDAKQGNLDLGLAKLGACMRIAQHAAGEDSLLIGHLVHIACDVLTLRRYEQVISMNANSRAGLERIELFMKRFPPLPSFRKAVESEIVLCRLAIKRIKSLDDLQRLASGDGSAPSNARWGQPDPKVFRAGLEARYIEFWRRSYPALKEKGAIEYGNELDKLAIEFSEKKDPTYVAVSILLPVYAQAGQASVRDNTIRMLNQTKIDILQYKLAKGRYPASLKDLGKVPVDPVNGEPFKYRVAGNGFILYGFGRNKVDDGVVVRTSGTTQTMLDDVVEHPMDMSKVVRK